MKAVALAAGLGTRLGPLTQELPKCMLDVGGAPLLWRNLEWAAANGISEVAVNLHYRAEAVTAYFHAHGAPVPVHWSPEPRLLGTAGTVSSLRDWLGDETFLVIYADNLIQCDLPALRRLHDRLHALATVALFEREDVLQSGVAELDREERIVRFVEKPSPGTIESHWVSAGLLVCEPQLAATAPAQGDIGRDLLPRLITDGQVVAGYRMGGRESLHWVDTPRDLARTRGTFAGVTA